MIFVKIMCKGRDVNDYVRNVDRKLNVEVNSLVYYELIKENNKCEIRNILRNGNC